LLANFFNTSQIKSALQWQAWDRRVVLWGPTPFSVEFVLIERDESYR